MDLNHVDTCLSCYVQDHCNGDHELLLGVPVTRASRMFEVRNLLNAEIDSQDVDKPGFDYDAAHVAVAEAFKGIHPLKAFDRSLESSDQDDDTAESCYAWFRLTWDVEDSDLDENHDLDDAVYDLSLALVEGRLNEAESPAEQEEIIAEAEASAAAINNAGVEAQRAFLEE